MPQLTKTENRTTHVTKEVWRYFRYEERDPKTGTVTLWSAETFEELPYNGGFA